MLLTKELLDIAMNFRWNFSLEICSHVKVDKFVKELKENIDSYINKIDWNKDKVTVSFNIPEYCSADFIRFLIEDNISMLQVDVKDAEEKILFTFQGFVDNLRNGNGESYYPADWNLQIGSEHVNPLVLNVTYKISTNKVF